MKNKFIGIDIGGTKIAVSLAGRSGEIKKRVIFPTRVRESSKDSIQEIISAISCLLSDNGNERELAGIGVGVPGWINNKLGIIEASPNLPGWERVPIKKILERRFRVKVGVENDANAAALGELYFGAGRGVSDFVYVTVSTGIGGGIIANGKLVGGAQNVGGEIGHTTVVPGGRGRLCSCGKRGCLEAYASGTAIAKFVQSKLAAGSKSNYFNQFKRSDITGKVVSEAASGGDKLAIQARENAADFLGIGLAGLMMTLNPAKVIIGGGVVTSQEHFWKPMVQAIKRECWPVHFKNCKIVRSELGGMVGDLGAIALALQEVKS
jgi:glucokinase